MKLSVIVPIYNVEKYIKQCLDSLQAQTFLDFEVLLVNDGSKDNSAMIAQQYVDQFPERFQLLNKQNGGLSDARNYAIPYARGNYIAFLDSDDFVEPTFYEKMVQCMDQGHDVVVCDIEYWYEDEKRRFLMSGLSHWKSSNIQKKALLSPMFAWNKIYDRKFFQEINLRYPIGTWYEDIPVTTFIFAKANSIGYVKEALVHYRQREGSIMSELGNRRLFEIFAVMEEVRNHFKKENLFEQYYSEIEYLHIEHLRLYGMFRFIRSHMEQEALNLANDIMEREFSHWRDNCYLSNLSFKNRLFLKFFSTKTIQIFRKLIH